MMSNEGFQVCIRTVYNVEVLAQALWLNLDSCTRVCTVGKHRL